MKKPFSPLPFPVLFVVFCSIVIQAASIGRSADAAGANARSRQERPNVLIIHTDEHSFRTLGCYRERLSEDEAYVWGPGVRVETPHIDSIAARGALAERYFATSPVCTPSRAAFVTGRYPQNTGSIQNDLPLRDDMVTFAEVLRRTGYATGYAGKWHLDGPGKPQFGPERHFGFEDNRYMFNRGHYKKLLEDEKGPRVGPVNKKGEPTYEVDGADEKSFTTDFLTTRAIEFIRAHRDRPFCYMLSLPDPHGPNTVRAPYDTMYDHFKFQLPKSGRSEGENLPGYAATQKNPFNNRQMSLYFGMVKCIDDNVGRLLAALRETGQLERTVVVFTADHGDLCGEHGRHNKGVPMDGSARIPFVIAAPGLIRPGTIVSPALGTVDFKPTLLGLLGVPSDGSDEGRDASGLFTGKLATNTWKDVAFVRIGGPRSQAAAGGDGEEGAVGRGWMGAFSQRYKFIVAPGASPSLFDLESDPHELKNLLQSPAHRDIIRGLGTELLGYARKHGEPLLQSPDVAAALEWASHGSGPYKESVPRPAAAPKGKKKKKAQQSD